MEGIGTVAAIGGFILAIVLLWATLMNKRRTAADMRRTEEATRALNRSIDRQDKVTDPDMGRF
ncbi:hypothetical protein Q4F19_05605 [Sphingomonas sp. BIUV-7]|uniref:Uncharacterized protein n=1 Tax=Sphingomonas natans TaxID=3063330 RepID=A0ABT8Y7Z0_9SPHN|nr:hypothetical protein [Sphingomonas sp. BIUV-7]MDO6413849.1 hypothetical protein [Sphingomonas sp. BIUV-7]